MGLAPGTMPRVEPAVAMKRLYFPKLPAWWSEGVWHCACPKCGTWPPFVVQAALTTVYEAP